ncbi:MAG: hypothetical protein ACQEWL_04655 [Pseudomonadota bacterium]
MKFANVDELLAHSSLSDESDAKLFVTQSVQVIDNLAIRWNFTIENGKDIHFQESLSYLINSDVLESFKRNHIRKTLAEINAGEYYPPNQL